MPRPLLGSHQRCWIWGRNVVRETLRAGLWRPYELQLAGEHEQAEIRELAERAEIPLTWESAARLTQRCGASDHQGVIAKMPPFPYASISELLGAEPQRLMISDHLQDPFNFGAMIRIADCFGASGIIIPRERQVGVTSQVARSSAGAVNYIPIARSEDLIADVRRLKEAGTRIVGASERAATALPSADLHGPLAVVLGNEGIGISPELLAECDVTVSIPISSPVGSLNAAVAAGIIFYEIAKSSEQ